MTKREQAAKRNLLKSSEKISFENTKNFWGTSVNEPKSDLKHGECFEQNNNKYIFDELCNAGINLNDPTRILLFDRIKDQVKLIPKRGKIEEIQNMKMILHKKGLSADSRKLEKIILIFQSNPDFAKQLFRELWMKQIITPFTNKHVA